MDDSKESIVEYEVDSHRSEVVGISTLFIDGGKRKHQQFIHMVCNFFSFKDLE